MTRSKIACRFILCLMLLPSSVFAAVILQYHHIGDTTPYVTSIKTDQFIQHMTWLKRHHFEVISLPELIQRHKKQQLSDTDKVAVITFDDAGISVCRTAWPILQEYAYPFTVFVSTELVEQNAPNLCRWHHFQTMFKSGLLTVGNHGHQHLHMLDVNAYPDQKHWRKAVIQEIRQAQTVIDRAMGPQPRLFAYPYGEYNQSLKDIVAQLGYSALGQQSGAIGNGSDVTALPRFPLSGKYADPNTLADKLNSLPFPIDLAKTSPHPLKIQSKHNPPELTLVLNKQLDSTVQCFLGNGEAIPTKQFNHKITVRYTKRLPTGRARYNCTATSPYVGRFYWHSYQWLVVEPTSLRER